MAIENTLISAIDHRLFEPEHVKRAELGGVVLCCDLAKKLPEIPDDEKPEYVPIDQTLFILQNPELRKLHTTDAIRAHRTYLKNVVKISQPEIELVTLHWEKYISTKIFDNLDTLSDEERIKTFQFVEQYQAFSDSSYAVIENNPYLQYYPSDYTYTPKSEEEILALEAQYTTELNMVRSAFGLLRNQNKDTYIEDLNRST